VVYYLDDTLQEAIGLQGLSSPVQESMASTKQVQQCNKLNDALSLMQLQDSVLVLTRKIIFNFYFHCTQTMINVWIIFLLCNIFKGKKVKIKMIQCWESPIQPKGIRFDPFLKFYFIFHRQGKWWKKCSPLPWSKGNLVGALSPSLLPNQVSMGQPNLFSWRKTKSPQGIPTPFSLG